EKNILNPVDRNNPHIGYDYFLNSDNMPVAIIKRTVLTLAEQLENYAKLINKKINITKVIPNEIALLNILKMNYDFIDEELTVLLFFGYEERFGIVLKGARFKSKFNLHVQGTEQKKILQNTFSKLILEQDTGNIPAGRIDNFFLCGKNVIQSDIDYFKERDFAKNVGFVKLKDSFFGKAVKTQNEDSIVSKFLLPIATAQSQLSKNDMEVLDINLLSSSIRESKKILKLNWLGFLLIFLLFTISLGATYINMILKEDIIIESQKTIVLNKKLNSITQESNKIRGLNNEILQLKSNIKEVDKIIGNKNQWSYILSKFQKYFRNNKIGWITSLKSSDENEFFIAQGYTIDRREVSEIADLFTNAVNKEVFREEIQEYEVWKFRITFEFPNRNNRILKNKKPKVIPKPKVKEKDTSTQKNSKKKITSTESTAPSKNHKNVVNNTNSDSPIKPKKDESTNKKETNLDKKEKIETPKNEVKDKSSTKKTSNKEEKIDKEDPSKRYNYLANLYLNGQYESAYKQLKEFVIQNPDKKQAYPANFLIAEYEFTIGNLDRSIEIFENLLEVNKYKQPYILYYLSKAYAKKNESDISNDFLSILKKDYPNHKLTISLKSELNDNQIQPLEKEKVEKKQVKENTEKSKLDETPKEIYNKIAKLYLQKEFEVSYNQLLDFVKTYPNDKMAYPAYFLIAEYEYAFGDVERSIEILGNLMEEEKYKQPYILYYLSKGYLKLEEIDLSLEYRKQLNNEYPNHSITRKLEKFFEEE
ncbi:MAG: hypothetical protein U9N34_06560, partial [Candidatus Cloacimonadota bacterium]|nr:hypothetical protein [Candidatus Cloacimonadota bacterium]